MPSVSKNKNLLSDDYLDPMIDHSTTDSSGDVRSNEKHEVENTKSNDETKSPSKNNKKSTHSSKDDRKKERKHRSISSSRSSKYTSSKRSKKAVEADPKYDRDSKYVRRTHHSSERRHHERHKRRHSRSLSSSSRKKSSHRKSTSDRKKSHNRTSNTSPRSRRSASSSRHSRHDYKRKNKSESPVNEKTRKSESTKKNSSEQSAQKKSKWDVSVPSASDPASFFSPFAALPTEDRRARRVYVGNLPIGIGEPAILQFFNGALLGAAGIDYTIAAAAGHLPAIRAEIFPEQRYCFLEFRTVADAAIALKLDGLSFNGYTLKIGKPNDYTAAHVPQGPSTPEALSTHLKKLIPEQKVYVADLPTTMSEMELRKLCESHGKVMSAAIMKDLRTGQYMGCGIVEFETAEGADSCVKNLNGQPLGGRNPRFTRGPLAPGNFAKLLESAKAPQTSTIVTDLPTSMTHKIFTNALIGAQVQAARKQGNLSSSVVQLLNCVYPEDLIKDEDCEAISEDIKKEVSEYGTILDVRIPRPPPDLSFKPGVGKVFVHFADITAARRAQAELNGRRFEERRVICAAFYPVDKFKNGVYSIT